MDLNFWKELSQSVKPNEPHTHTQAIVFLYQKQDMTG